MFKTDKWYRPCHYCPGNYHFRKLDLIFYTSGCFTDRNERALQGNEGKR